MSTALMIAVKYGLGFLFLLSVALFLAFLCLRAYLQHRNAREMAITSPTGISSLETVMLGGVEQSILIRGHNRTRPILLYLHGGPGGAEINVARYFYASLEKDFLVVHWDQRGAGKSYSSGIPPQSMTVGQLVEDTRELAEQLRRRFEAAKVYLVGHSWGSMLGALTASRYPGLFHAFVGVGQNVHTVEAEKISYDFTLRKAVETGNDEALLELKRIGAPPYDDFRKMKAQRKWLEKFGGVNHTPLFGNEWWMGATSPDCVLIDAIRYSRGLDFSTKHLWDEVNEVNLFRDAPRIEVPVYLFAGRHDYNTPFELAERYFERLEAPRGRQLIWFEYSAHMIPWEEPGKFRDVLVNKVLRETYHG